MTKRNLIRTFTLVVTQSIIYGQTSSPPDGHNPQIISINGETHLGINWVEKFIAPAHKGAPPYTYIWTARGSRIGESGDSCLLLGSKVELINLTASIIDTDGGKDTKSISITIHEEVELSNQSSSTELQEDKKKFVGAVSNEASVTQSITLKETWNLSAKVGVEISVPVKVLVKLGITGEIAGSLGEEVNMPIIAPPKTRVSLYVMPAVTINTGDYRVWHKGLYDSGKYSYRDDPKKVYVFKEEIL